MLNRSKSVLPLGDTEPGLLYRIGRSRKESVRSIIRVVQWFVNDKVPRFVILPPKSLRSRAKSPVTKKLFQAEAQGTPRKQSLSTLRCFAALREPFCPRFRRHAAKRDGDRPRRHFSRQLTTHGGLELW